MVSKRVPYFRSRRFERVCESTRDLHMHSFECQARANVKQQAQNMFYDCGPRFYFSKFLIFSYLFKDVIFLNLILLFFILNV